MASNAQNLWRFQDLRCSENCLATQNKILTTTIHPFSIYKLCTLCNEKFLYIRQIYILISNLVQYAIICDAIDMFFNIKTCYIHILYGNN